LTRLGRDANDRCTRPCWHRLFPSNKASFTLSPPSELQSQISVWSQSHFIFGQTIRPTILIPRSRACSFVLTQRSAEDGLENISQIPLIIRLDLSRENILTMPFGEEHGGACLAQPLTASTADQEFHVMILASGGGLGHVVPVQSSISSLAVPAARSIFPTHSLELTAISRLNFLDIFQPQWLPTNTMRVALWPPISSFPSWLWS
jgi:hypothetical protein